MRRTMPTERARWTPLFDLGLGGFACTGVMGLHKLTAGDGYT
jgi:hypothetical protein